MPYDEGLAQRVREELSDLPNLVEKKMFGGVCFLLHGNMACGIIREDLIVRVGPERYEKALSQKHVKLFDITGKAMKGWVMVSPEGYESDEALKSWLKQGIDFAQTLPPKAA